MITISYDIGCRNCLQSDSLRHSYLVDDENIQYYKDLTEYELMKQVEEWREEDNHSCEFCGSTNIEVLKTDVNGYMNYDYDRLVRRCIEKDEQMFQINIDKRNSQLSINVGGSDYILPDFFNASLQAIAETITERPVEQFKANQKGNFFICVTGSIYVSNLKSYVKIESFRSAGLTKQDLLDAIKPAATRNGVPFEI